MCGHRSYRRDQWGIRFIKVLVLVLLFLPGCAYQTTRFPWRTCSSSTVPLFQSTGNGGWLGSDDAMSIVLPTGKTLWLYGDTWIGSASGVNRAGSQFASNSIGISNCPAGSWGGLPGQNFFWQRLPNGRRKGYFYDPFTTGFWWWPVEGFVYQNALYIFADRVVTPRGGGFQQVSTDLLTGTNLNPNQPLGDDPTLWHWSAPQTVIRGESPLMGSSINNDGTYLYMVGFNDDWSAVLTRCLLANLDNIAASLEYYSQDGTWHLGFDTSDAQRLFSPGAPEMSIRYHPSNSTWYAFYTYPFPPAQGVNIYERTAPALTGPWSPPTSVYVIPETDSGSDHYNPTYIAYAGKEHIEWATNSSTVVTYAVNSTDFFTLVEDMTIYYPIPVVIPLP